MEMIIASFSVVIGLGLGVLLIALTLSAGLLVLPFFKSGLLDNPNDPPMLTIFAAPEPGQAMLVMRGERVEHVIHGKGKGEGITSNEETFQNPLLKAYDRYAFLFGLRLVGIPGIHSIKHYDLPRYRKIEEDGKLVYKAVDKDDPSRKSNHYRTQLTAWFSEFGGVDIEGLPFDVKCATNFRISEGLVSEIAFGIDSWNTLLDQALGAVARGYIREEVTLEEALGATSKSLYDKDDYRGAITKESQLQGAILSKLQQYKPKQWGNGATLAELGLIIEGFEILDFSPQELTEPEMVKLRAPALARREAQARAMAGAAEAEYQAKVLEALSKHPELARLNVEAEAFVKAAGSGSLDALVAGLLRNLTGRK